MPVCIAGMHRSGTSMIAKLLQLCGLSLGPPDLLLPPTQDNPEGYWEHQTFVGLNDKILKALDGSWYCPPVFVDGWELLPEICQLLDQGASLVQEWKAGEVWGWKDPRNSITLPFWSRLIPELQVVICVRNPLEVAQSLHLRDRFSYSHGLSLWQHYHDKLLTNVPAAARVVTHYDVYFAEPVAELQRVLSLLGIPASHEDVERACAAASPGLKHNRMTTTDLEAAQVPAEILDCYRSLCAQAGPHCERLLQSDRAATPASDGSPAEAPSSRQVVLKHALQLEAQLRDMELRLIHNDGHLRDKDAQVKRLELEISNCLRHIAAKEKETEELLQKQLWKRYVIADRLAVYYWNIRHPLKGLARGKHNGPMCQPSDNGGENGQIQEMKGGSNLD